jgi:peptide/nickel transport system permease protein
MGASSAWARADTRVRRSMRDAGRGLRLGSILRSASGKTGVLLVSFIVAVTVVGPTVAPHSPNEIAGVPFTEPGGSNLLGTDFLGRDVLSRILNGGRELLATALLATFVAYLIGVPLGLAIGYRRGPADVAAVGLADLIIAFPPIILALMIIAGLGSGALIVAGTIAAIHVPRIVRIVRTATIEASAYEYVEAAVARGEGSAYILRRELLPNIVVPIMADFGIRLTASVIIVSSLSFLGLGPAPPSSDWGLMISENRLGLLIQPWVVVVPALLIGLLAIGVNLMADAYARSVGRSAEEEGTAFA